MQYQKYDFKNFEPRKSPFYLKRFRYDSYKTYLY